MKIYKTSQLSEDPSYSNKYFNQIDQNFIESKVINLINYLDDTLSGFNEDAKSIKSKYEIPENTCPLIDGVLKASAKIEDLCRDISRHNFENEDDEKEISSISTDIDYSNSDIQSVMEDIRTANDTLRHLGISWYKEHQDITDELRKTINDLSKFINN